MQHEIEEPLPNRSVRISDTQWSWATRKANACPQGQNSAGQVVRNALTKYQISNPIENESLRESPTSEPSKTGEGANQDSVPSPSPDSTSIEIESRPDVSFEVPLT